MILIWLLAIIPSAVVTAAVITPPQYDDSYYGELAQMYARLREAEGKKIILIGGSSIAFGVNVKMVEDAFPGYTVCPFGLYGAIGTKAMLDLSKVNISEGDIVLISPEPNPQTMSLYFSATNMWMAVDSDYCMLRYLAWENYGAMAGTGIDYTADKLRYLYEGIKPTTDGVYARDAFDENCSMSYERAYNIMPLLYSGTKVDFSAELVRDDLAAYLNDYYAYCYDRGASVYFNFCPVNALAVADYANLDSYFETLNQKLRFPILGQPENYIFDWEWFFDSDFHMNTPGMSVYSNQLIRDLKFAIEDTHVELVSQPDKPVIPASVREEDEADLDCFILEEIETGYTVIGLTETGRKRTELTIPASCEGKAVRTIEAGVFAGNEQIERITVPETIGFIPDCSFEGCTALREIRFEADHVTCAVGGNLLEGTQAYIYVSTADVYAQYVVDYYWAQYAQRIRY